MLTAGASARLEERTTLDLAWRYTDIGTVCTDRVLWCDGSQEPCLLDLAEAGATVRGHGLRVSLRYAF